METEEPTRGPGGELIITEEMRAASRAAAKNNTIVPESTIMEDKHEMNEAPRYWGTSQWDC